MPKHKEHGDSVEVLDPVCGMTITATDAVGHVDYQGQTYHFCSEHCVKRFQAAPESFISDASRPPVPAR